MGETALPVPRVDDTDKKILGLLLKDGRLPFSRIAKELGVSEATIHLRLRKLREMGVIKGFSVDLDPGLLGLPIVAFILVRVSPARIREVAESIAVMKQVFEVHVVTGEYQLLVKARTPDPSSIADLVKKIGCLEGVLEVAIIESLKTVKEEHKPPLG